MARKVKLRKQMGQWAEAGESMGGKVQVERGRGAAGGIVPGAAVDADGGRVGRRGRRRGGRG